jgi:hypothetical protein
MCDRLDVIPASRPLWRILQGETAGVKRATESCLGTVARVLNRGIKALECKRASAIDPAYGGKRT